MLQFRAAFESSINQEGRENIISWIGWNPDACGENKKLTRGRINGGYRGEGGPRGVPTRVWLILEECPDDGASAGAQKLRKTTYMLCDKAWV